MGNLENYPSVFGRLSHWPAAKVSEVKQQGGGLRLSSFRIFVWLPVFPVR